jgi:hypothetical protein
MPNQNEFKVNEQAPQGLNLRSEPDPTANNIIAVIPHGHAVTKLGDSNNPNWWRVETALNGTTATGFVNKKFLSPATGSTPVAHQGVVAAHLSTAGMTVTRQNARRAHPLTEVPPVKRHQNDSTAQKVDALRQLIDWFKVESSPRYLPTGGATFCNIYTYDYCFMADAYLPRVWWNQQAIIKLDAGQVVPVSYGDTVDEITANGLHNWFKDWGTHFGWRRTVDLTEMQDEANQGKVCITVARAKQQFHHGHGHIVAVVPENNTFQALRENGKVIKTVQSQAGAHNQDYVVKRWWDDGTYADFGHWIHD